MDVHSFSHCRRVPLAVAVAMLCFTATSPAAGSQFGPVFFTGGGYGPTADVAIQSALWDAQESASYFQLYNCQLFGEISIFAGSNSRRGRNFTAQVTVACTS